VKSNGPLKLWFLQDIRRNFSRSTQGRIECFIGPPDKSHKVLLLGTFPWPGAGQRWTLYSNQEKNGHVLIKDYRPVSLTSIILKTLERLVDKFLKSGSSLLKLLALFQYTYREGRSTDTALHHLWGVETQLGVKGYALEVFVDIEEPLTASQINPLRKR